MKNEEMLKAINGILSTLDPLDICTRLDLEELKSKLESDIALETCRSAGTLSQLRAVKRILKTAVRPEVQGAAMQSGRQCVCDGFRAVRLNQPLPLDPVENEASFIDLDKVILPDRYTRPVELPQLRDLKAALKISRASWTGRSRDYKPYPWFLGSDLPAVNPQFLVDMLEALPGARCFADPNDTGRICPLYFAADAGDGILLPVNPRGLKKYLNAPDAGTRKGA